MARVKVAETAELLPGNGMVVLVEGQELALFNVNGVFYCTENECPHREGPLGEGELTDDVVMCPWHAWTFNVRTGENADGFGICLKTYPCVVENGDVLVEL
jgi:nitrite reductase (NADH) small subunit